MQPGDSPVPDSVVALIDGEPLTVSEFIAQYERSETAPRIPESDSSSGYRDFLRRYVDFRLKVREARAAGYAETEDLQREIETYRSQLARPYLMDQEVIDPLVREMYKRRRQAVEVSHILIRLPGDASPSDTLQAYERLVAIRDSILAGADFGDMAYRHSEDPSATRIPDAAGYRGKLGYFGGGRMVKSFEDVAYDTDVGGISDIFRSRFGYHILMVHDRIEMPPDREIAHIMIRPAGQAPADTATAESRVDEVRKRLNSGEDFGELAKEFSDDQNSAQNGGNLGVISFDGGLPFAMRDSAFAIQNVGDIAGPVQTQFGYHFVKLLEEIPLGELNEEYESLKNQVSRMPRLESSQAAFAMKIRKNLGVSADTSLIRSWERSMTPDSLFRTLAQANFSSDIMNRQIASLGDSAITVKAFSEWFSTQRTPSGSSPMNRVLAALDNYLNELAIAHEVDRLEERDAEFRRTMQEFRNGLMLFRLMEDSVWTAAAEDTTALREYYQEHKQQYQFGDRTRVVSFSSPSDSVLKVFSLRTDSLTTSEAFNSLAADSTISIRVDTTFIEGPTNSVYDRVLDLDAGELSDPISYNRGFIILEHGGIDPAHPKSFKEARAEVVNQHQAILEQRLLSRLRNKYGARLFPEHLPSPPDDSSDIRE